MPRPALMFGAPDHEGACARLGRRGRVPAMELQLPQLRLCTPR